MQRFVPIEDVFKGRHFDGKIILCVAVGLFHQILRKPLYTGDLGWDCSTYRWITHKFFDKQSAACNLAPLVSRGGLLNVGVE